jgi:hypothetical protein
MLARCHASARTQGLSGGETAPGTEMSVREEAGWIDMKVVRKAEEHLRTECGSARHLLLAFAALTEQYEAGTSAASECAPKTHSLRLETMSLLRQMAERPFSSSGSTRLVLQKRSGRSGVYCRNSWRLWCTHPYSPRQETGFLKRQGAARLRRKRNTQRGPTESTRQLWKARHRECFAPCLHQRDCRQ